MTTGKAIFLVFRHEFEQPVLLPQITRIFAEEEEKNPRNPR
jgi:hypothetical protein